VNYDGLMYHGGLREGFMTTVQQNIAKFADVMPDRVKVSMSEGSVKVIAEVTMDPETNAEEFLPKLEKQAAAMGSVILGELMGLRDVHTVVTGVPTISVVTFVPAGASSTTTTRTSTTSLTTTKNVSATAAPPTMTVVGSIGLLVTTPEAFIADHNVHAAMVQGISDMSGAPRSSISVDFQEPPARRRLQARDGNDNHIAGYFPVGVDYVIIADSIEFGEAYFEALLPLGLEAVRLALVAAFDRELDGRHGYGLAVSEVSRPLFLSQVIETTVVPTALLDDTPEDPYVGVAGGAVGACALLACVSCCLRTRCRRRSGIAEEALKLDGGSSKVSQTDSATSSAAGPAPPIPCVPLVSERAEQTAPSLSVVGDRQCIVGEEAAVGLAGEFWDDSGSRGGPAGVGVHASSDKVSSDFAEIQIDVQGCGPEDMHSRHSLEANAQAMLGLCKEAELEARRTASQRMETNVFPSPHTDGLTTLVPQVRASSERPSALSGSQLLALVTGEGKRQRRSSGAGCGGPLSCFGFTHGPANSEPKADGQRT